MFRLALLSPLLALALQIAQAQLVSPGPPASVLSPTSDGRTHGAPASVLSPTPDGRTHGAPASVLSLKPVPANAQPQRRVHSSFVPQGPLRPLNTHRRNRDFAPVPLFYPVYSYGYDSPSAADPDVSQVDAGDPADDSATAAREDALRQAYLRGARDAMRHELETAKAKPAPVATSAPAPSPAAAPEPDDTPFTVFIFKDGHQIETRNFAIMGQTLYDLSSSTVKKIQLNDLDTTATLRANDDRGVQLKLP